MDSASRSGYFVTALALNGDTKINRGYHAIDGNHGSTNYRSMNVAGTLYLRKDDTVSVFVYSSADNDFTVTSESGFSCHKFGQDYSACKSESHGKNAFHAFST